MKNGLPPTRTTPLLPTRKLSIRSEAFREAASIAGRQASDDWVETATTWAGAAARAKRPRLTLPKTTASG